MRDLSTVCYFSAHVDIAEGAGVSNVSYAKKDKVLKLLKFGNFEFVIFVEK